MGHHVQNTLQSSLRIPVEEERRSSRLETKTNSTKVLSSIPALVKKSPVKLTTKMAQKGWNLQKPAKIVRKVVPKNTKKKVHGPSSYISRTKPKTNVTITDNETIAVNVTMEKVRLNILTNGSI